MYLIYYLVFINLLASLLTGYDKITAKHGMYRVPERVLWCVGLCGGAFFMYAVMRLIRHKTLHKSFMIGLPFLIILQIALIFLLVYKGVVV